MSTRGLVAAEAGQSERTFTHRALLRVSADVTTKSPKTRGRFVRRISDNLRRGLATAGLEGRIRTGYGRMYLEFDDPRALAVARRTFGVLSVSPCREVPVRTLDDVVRAGHELMSARVTGKTFGVRARVRDRTLGFDSNAVNHALGAALRPLGRVRLDDPDVRVQVEVRTGRAWFFTDVIPAEGGIPVGEGGRAVVLLSGGFDSAVAAWLLLRRGVACDFVCCRLGGDAHARPVLAIANHLSMQWAPGIASRLAIVPFEDVVAEMQRVVAPRFWQLVLKRLMYRVAESCAHRVGAHAIVTGESLGQVSSQTLSNLRAIEGAATLPILRPLISQDKNEIVALARHIGTETMCAGVTEYCALDAPKPATRSTAEQLAREEAKLGLDVASLGAGTALLSLPTGFDDDRDGLEVDHVPEGAQILDLRSPPSRSERPVEGAVPIDALDVLEHPERLDARIPHVVVCDAGLRSAWFVRRLRALGLRAFSLRA